jgi:hypothetical protein
MSWSNISVFFYTVVVSCMHPLNWEACLPVQDWLLIPAVHDYIRFKEGIYVNEKRVLEQSRLDGGRAKP